MRHTASHVLAQAVLRLYPEAELGIGPVIDDGFYYDFLFPGEFSAADLPAIQKEMQKIIAEDLPLVKFVLEREEALKSVAGKPFKTELVQDLPEGEEIGFYRQGEFTDLCKGPHVESTGQVGHFRLLSTSGAYWRGSEKNQMLHRIYGTAFPTKEELKAYLARLEEAKKRDHRVLGQRLGLFEIFQEEAGSGMVFWLPKGATMVRLLTEWSRRMHAAKGYREVATPHLVSTNLWQKSGHLDNFREHMYICPDEDDPDVGMGVRPMNCPGHMLLYKMKRRSYRELPLRLQEFGTVYRNEKGGTMHGLMRVKGFTQDDAHIFCRMDQLEAEILLVLELALETWRALGFKSAITLKGRPPVAIGEAEDWERAEAALRGAAAQAGLEFDYIPDDGAFYGPKIDFEIEDALGRKWQCGTVQVDFNLPARFGLSYVDESDTEQVPVVIHRAILGSLERSMGIVIEHFGGEFPLWLTPVQAIILPISDRHMEPARALADMLTAAGHRVEMDARSETIGKKIREAEIAKIPYMLVIGDREAEAGTASVRHGSKGTLGPLAVADVAALFEAEGRLP